MDQLRLWFSSLLKGLQRIIFSVQSTLGLGLFTDVLEELAAPVISCFPRQQCFVASLYPILQK